MGRLRPIFASALLSTAVLPSAGIARTAPATLIPVASLNAVVNGVAVTPGGRVFVCVQPQSAAQTVEVAELVDGRLTPFPTASWNDWRPGTDAASRFIGVNALRLGPDGDLWVVDKGSHGLAAAPVSGGPKLVRIDVRSGTVRRSYDLAAVAGAGTFVDDVRFHGRHAYITEAAKGALIVLDLDTGALRRVLEHDPSMLGRPMIAQGKPLRFPGGQPVVINVDQIEVSPDGRWVYFQAPSGPMRRIETRYLDDPALSDAELRQHVEPFAATAYTGGTAIDAAGNIYATDVDKSRILKIDPRGTITTVIADPRLSWADALWLDDKGYLWIPVPQLNRTPTLNGGVDAVQYPIHIFKLFVDLPRKAIGG